MRRNYWLTMSIEEIIKLILSYTMKTSPEKLKLTLKNLQLEVYFNMIQQQLMVKT